MRITAFLAMTMVLAITANVAAQQPRKAASAPVAAQDDRAADRAAIREELKAFAQDFAARDARKLAAHWTVDGEHQTAHGLVIHGRQALEQSFADFFAATPELQAEVQPDRVRFLSTGAAIDEGVVTVRKGPTAPPQPARYEAILVREDKQWRIARLTESPIEGDSIRDLSWLIGEWKSMAGGAAEIRTTYTWDPQQHFILSQFQITEGERTLTGRQVIGVDPATGSLHTWTFEANGGVGEADWTRDGDHWLLDAAGSLPNGRTLKERNILRRVNSDTFTWQSTLRSLDGQPLDDLPPVKVTRLKSEK